MKNCTAWIVVLVCAPASLFPQGEPGQTPGVRTEVVRAIEKVHETIRTSAERLDVAGLYSHVLDELAGVIIEDGRIRWSRAEAEESTRTAMEGFRRLSYSYSRKAISELGPGLVLWVGEGTATVTLRDGREFSAPFAETVVFKAEGSTWRVLHAHRSAPSR